MRRDLEALVERLRGELCEYELEEFAKALWMDEAWEEALDAAGYQRGFNDGYYQAEAEHEVSPRRIRLQAVDAKARQVHALT